MDDQKVQSDGTWLCRHEGGHASRLGAKDARSKPPHYVICPECGTHWIIWELNGRKLAKPVVVPVYG